MDFDWSAEEDELYQRIRRVSAAVGGGIEDRDRTATFAHDDWAACAAAGLTGLAISREWGGLGLECLATARALEGFGRECPDAGLAFSLAAHLLACAKPIDLYGTPQQKQAFLPGLASGTLIGANAMSEREAGSDISAIQTRAVRDGDDYVLTGDKVFVTNAPTAHVFLAYASTCSERSFFGLTAFLVERDRAGLTVGPPLEKGGLTTAPVSWIRFDNCRVPQCQRLGEEGSGGGIFHASMGWERSCLFALWLGTMHRQLDEVVRHAKVRRQFGRPIGTNQAVSHRIADMTLRLESARLLLYRACWARDRGRTCDLETSLAKIAVSEAFVQSSLDAARIFGGAGVLRGTSVERYLRDALPGTVYSGTNEMQREIVARMLGLPQSRGR